MRNLGYIAIAAGAVMLAGCDDQVPADAEAAATAEAELNLDSANLLATVERLDLTVIPVGAQTFERSNWLCIGGRNRVCDGAGSVSFIDQDSGSLFIEWDLEGGYDQSYSYRVDFEIVDGMMCYPAQPIVVSTNSSMNVEQAQQEVAEFLFPEGLAICDVFAEDPSGSVFIASVRESGVLSSPPERVELRSQKPRML